MAVDGFAQSQVGSINKVLRGPNSESAGGGDSLQFAGDISKSFFSVLLEATRSFFELFDSHCDNPSIMSLLVDWVQNQTTSFIEVLARQVCNIILSYF
jgi:hypothetical protein